MSRKTLATFAAIAALAFAAPAGASPRYTFSQGGFEHGAQVSGWFEGADGDGDGWILSYEVTGSCACCRRPQPCLHPARSRWPVSDRS